MVMIRGQSLVSASESKMGVVGGRRVRLKKGKSEVWIFVDSLLYMLVISHWRICIS